MITEQDLQEAIAECEGVRNPTSSTCLKLAAYYTLQEKMFGKKDQFAEVGKMISPQYSYAKDPDEQIDKVIEYSSDTEFSQAIYMRKEAEIWPIIDELMSVLQATNTRLYNGVMRKIES